ncbi:MAG TPA: LLM class flavin-dependent oxidoreductase [Acidimicrobiales bacterium]|nr:LLM class flavin-dependent oxidoreductase [Acidimicrobiales bacterium]
MKFGIFYEHQLPRPWTEDSERQLLQDALDQVELADKIGFDVVWEVEHHFLEEYSHSSAPEVFLAAASQRTKNIRIGHGIVQLTTNHPARVAERIATLDLVSDGRVEFGMGEGASTTELHPFDRKFLDKRLIWEDAVKCLIPMFGTDRWEYHGPYFDFPVRNVLPKPYQKPHPPLWVACSQLETIEMAAHRGLGALGFQFVSGDAARAWVNHYYRTFTSDLEPLTEYRTNPNIALVSGFMCAPTDEEARAKAEGWTFFQFSLRYYAQQGAAGVNVFEGKPMNLWKEYLAWRETPAGQKVANNRALIGSPATLRDRLHKWETTHVDQIILLNQAGKTTHADIMDSLQLFASEVMPEFHENDAKHQEWKQGVLAHEIELDDIDMTPYLVPTLAAPTKPPRVSA